MFIEFDMIDDPNVVEQNVLVGQDVLCYTVNLRVTVRTLEPV